MCCRSSLAASNLPGNRANCMILRCPQCATRYSLEAKAILPDGQEVRCAKCGYTWHQSVAEESAAGLASMPSSGSNEGVQQHGSDRDLERPAYRKSPPNRTQRKIPLVPTWILVVLAAAAAWGVAQERSAAPQPNAINFGAVAYRREMHNGRPVLIVRGSIVNSGPRDQSVPQVEAVLADASGQPLDRWTFRPEVRRLRAGEEARFRTWRVKPPETAQSLALHLKGR